MDYNRTVKALHYHRSLVIKNFCLYSTSTVVCIFHLLSANVVIKVSKQCEIYHSNCDSFFHTKSTEAGTTSAVIVVLT